MHTLGGVGINPVHYCVMQAPLRHGATVGRDAMAGVAGTLNEI